MSDCILCGEASGGSEYAICGDCCEANAASDREIVGCCRIDYLKERCMCCHKVETEKRSGPQLIAYGFVALFSFSAGVACGLLL